MILERRRVSAHVRRGAPAIDGARARVHIPARHDRVVHHVDVPGAAHSLPGPPSKLQPLAETHRANGDGRASRILRGGIMGRRLILFILRSRSPPRRSARHPLRPRRCGASELYGGWSSYAMSDFNDSLASVNQALGSNFQDITSGAAGGFGVRRVAERKHPVASRLRRAARRHEAIPASPSTSAPAVFHSAARTSSRLEGTVRFGIGAGMGFYSIVGKVEGPGASRSTPEAMCSPCTDGRSHGDARTGLLVERDPRLPTRGGVTTSRSMIRARTRRSTSRG